MSLISKNHLSLTLQSIKKLLSGKADKNEVESVKLSIDSKVDKSELDSVQLSINSKADKSEVESSLKLKADKNDVSELTQRAGIVYYGTCDTAASTSEKVVSLQHSSANFKLKIGAIVNVKFTYSNTNVYPTLNVASTGAKSIKLLNSTYSISSYWQPYSCVTFLYDGSCWNIISISPSEATINHYGLTKLNDSYTSSSKVTAATADAVRNAYNRGDSAYNLANAALPKSGGTMTGDLTLKGNPTSNLHAATKAYVDETIATIEEDIATIEENVEKSASEMLVYKNTTAFPSDVWVHGIIYGGDKFIAINCSGRSGNAAYSLDGINWFHMTMPSGYDYFEIVYGNDKFVTIGRESWELGSKGKIFYSLDGITWTPITSSINFYYYDLAYGNGKFVATTDNGLAYSENGIDWTSTNTLAHAVNYCNDRFIALKLSGSTSSIIYYSTDGINWTNHGKISGHFYSAVYGNGIFIMYGYGPISPNKFIAYSTDCVNWSRIDSPPFDNIIYCDNKFLGATSDAIYYSEDGINWHLTSTPSGISLGSVAYGDGKFVATTYQNYSDVAIYSVDGIHWGYIAQNEQCVIDEIKALVSSNSDVTTTPVVQIITWGDDD